MGLRLSAAGIFLLGALGLLLHSTLPQTSYPASHTWQVSRQTPTGRATRSMISRGSRNCPPSSVPFPDMVSSSTVVRCSGRSTALSVSATWRIPVSVPWPVWLPGWRL